MTGRNAHRSNSPRNGMWWLALAVAAVFVAYRLSSPPAASMPDWNSNYDESLRQAKREQKKLLIAFHMRGCPPCTAMERNVLSASKVKESLREFVLARVDAAEDSSLANRLGVIGTPAYAVVDTDGNLIARADGYQPADEFIQFLKHSSQPAAP